MRGKYITTLVLMACMSKSSVAKKSIHAQIEETIAERKRILEGFEKLFQSEAFKETDLHAELQQNINQHKKQMQDWGNAAVTQNNPIVIGNNKTAA